MSYDQIYAIASQGLQAEKWRIEVVANNIANQHAVQNNAGKLFQPQHVMTTAKPFSDWMNKTPEMGIDTIELLPEQRPPNKVYQPGHPKADKKGYVTYPGISTIDEMTTLIRASRAYEANIKIFNTAHSLYLQTLTIGEER